MNSLRNSRKFLYLSLVGGFFLSACSHVRTLHVKNQGESGSHAHSSTLSEVLQQEINYSDSNSAPSNSRASKFTPVENGEVIVQGIKLKNVQFDIPITVNSRVEYWIDYFCGRGRGYFEKYLERSKFFVPYIVPLLKQNGLPEDLVYLAMIESGFNNLARSRAKAVGPWQFISATGKRYGLMVNGWIDERKDTRKSTLAAVEYLRDLYGMFQSWELAAAAYNAGEAKVARAIRRFGTKDFWEISRHRFLRPETRDYVPKIIAAALVAKNRAQFGFSEPAVTPGVDEAVAGDGEVVKLEEVTKVTAETEAKEKAVAIRDVLESDAVAEEIVPDPETAPVESKTLTSSRHSASPDSAPSLAKPIPTPHVTKSGHVGGVELAEFEVKSPADLLKVARAAGLSYHTVKSLNPEILRWCTPPIVSTYRIKLPVTSKERFLTTYNHEAFPKKVEFRSYKVRRGETLSRIARRLGIKVDLVSDLNGMSPRTPLRNGSQILLPIPNDRTRTFASLDIIDPPSKRRVRAKRRGHRGYNKVNYKLREAARSLSMRGRS